MGIGYRFTCRNYDSSFNSSYFNVKQYWRNQMTYEHCEKALFEENETDFDNNIFSVDLCIYISVWIQFSLWLHLQSRRKFFSQKEIERKQSNVWLYRWAWARVTQSSLIAKNSLCDQPDLRLWQFTFCTALCVRPAIVALKVSHSYYISNGLFLSEDKRLLKLYKLVASTN